MAPTWIYTHIARLSLHDALRSVELTTFSQPATPIDRVKELGAAGWVRRQTAKALKRLRMIFEEPPSGELKRATIAGYDPSKAARFGVATGTDPARAPRREAS
jgi:hypothetical protein